MCDPCTISYQSLENKIHQLGELIKGKDELLNDLISVAEAVKRNYSKVPVPPVPPVKSTGSIQETVTSQHQIISDRDLCTRCVSEEQVEVSLDANSLHAVGISSTPQPLFQPTTLIIGDSIIRKVRYFNAITHSIPGATASIILNKLQDLYPSLPSSIKRIVLHVGTNDTILQQSEKTKNDFRKLLSFLGTCDRTVFISGPIPTSGRGSGRFSRILSLHTWLQFTCRTQDFAFIDNFNLFWNRGYLFMRDGVHLNNNGSRILKTNLNYCILTTLSSQN
uniref:SGNH hydrolase-type esterase domain-containing protein n=1 Tax=Poecilia latipinna TaxID=48699 RepID=A0A3B3V567_9TELE